MSETEKPCRPWYLRSYREALRSLRGHNVQLLLGNHNPADVTIGGQRLDRLFGFSPQGGKKEPIVQTAGEGIPQESVPTQTPLRRPW